jgi:hypothetical protein
MLTSFAASWYWRVVIRAAAVADAVTPVLVNVVESTVAAADVVVLMNAVDASITGAVTTTVHV